MKKVYTTIIDTLQSYFGLDQAYIVADDATEFGFRDLNELGYNLWDHLSDYVSEDQAKEIVKEIIASI